jgi:uncharacterized protein YndB with AHSA1/START domain
MSTEYPPIILEVSFECEASVLWRALTDANEMRQWFFPQIPSFEAVQGFQTVFDVSTGERVFPHRWTLKEVRPENLISYFWEYDNYEGKAIVSFEITESDGKTMLRFESKVLEDFAAKIPEFTYESGVEGWNHFILKQLPQHIDQYGR